MQEHKFIAVMLEIINQALPIYKLQSYSESKFSLLLLLRTEVFFLNELTALPLTQIAEASMY